MSKDQLCIRNWGGGGGTGGGGKDLQYRTRGGAGDQESIVLGISKYCVRST